MDPDLYSVPIHSDPEGHWTRIRIRGTVVNYQRPERGLPVEVGGQGVPVLQADLAHLGILHLERKK